MWSDIDKYGLQAKILFDLQVLTDLSYENFNILASTNSNLTLTIPTRIGTNFSTFSFTALLLPVLQTNSGPE